LPKRTLPELVPTSQAASNLRIDGSKQRPSAESADQPSTAASSATSSPTIAGSVEEARRDIKKAEEQGVLAPHPRTQVGSGSCYNHRQRTLVRIIIFFLFTNIAASESWTERDRNFTGMVCNDQHASTPCSRDQAESEGRRGAISRPSTDL